MIEGMSVQIPAPIVHVLKFQQRKNDEPLFLSMGIEASYMTAVTHWCMDVSVSERMRG